MGRQHLIKELEKQPKKTRERIKKADILWLDVTHYLNAGRGIKFLKIALDNYKSTF